MRNRPYYTLVLREDGDSRWHPEFGDYDRAIVQAELELCAAHDYLRKNARIISTAVDTQAAIDAAVASLNAPQP